MPWTLNIIDNIEDKDWCQYDMNNTGDLDGESLAGNDIGECVCTFAGCGKIFNSKWSMTRHLRTHTGNKPFKCLVPGCGKEFVEKCALKRHAQTHAKVKLWSCNHPGCVKKFKLKEYLDVHRRTHLPYEMEAGQEADFQYAAQDSLQGQGQGYAAAPPHPMHQQQQLLHSNDVRPATAAPMDQGPSSAPASSNAGSSYDSMSPQAQGQGQGQGHVQQQQQQQQQQQLSMPPPRAVHQSQQQSAGASTATATTTAPAPAPAQTSNGAGGGDAAAAAAEYKSMLDKLRARLVRLSMRHHDELAAQAAESEWLKQSLLECSNALHESISLLRAQERALNVLGKAAAAGDDSCAVSLLLNAAALGSGTAGSDAFAPAAANAAALLGAPGPCCPGDACAPGGAHGSGPRDSSALPSTVSECNYGRKEEDMDQAKLLSSIVRKVPASLAEVAAKFNSENISAACKTANVAPSSAEQRSFLSMVNGQCGETAAGASLAPSASAGAGKGRGKTMNIIESLMSSAVEADKVLTSLNTVGAVGAVGGAGAVASGRRDTSLITSPSAAVAAAGTAGVADREREHAAGSLHPRHPLLAPGGGEYGEIGELSSRARAGSGGDSSHCTSATDSCASSDGSGAEDEGGDIKKMTISRSSANGTSASAPTSVLGNTSAPCATRSCGDACSGGTISNSESILFRSTPMDASGCLLLNPSAAALVAANVARQKQLLMEGRGLGQTQQSLAPAQAKEARSLSDQSAGQAFKRVRPNESL